MIHETIRETAARELHEEKLRAAIEAEKTRLRNRKTAWQHIVAMLPFTITWKKKP